MTSSPNTYRSAYLHFLRNPPAKTTGASHTSSYWFGRNGGKSGVRMGKPGSIQRAAYMAGRKHRRIAPPRAFLAA